MFHKGVGRRGGWDRGYSQAVSELPPALSSKPISRKRISATMQAAERREQVLERLTGAFAKRGYQAATVDHLVTSGKISMGGFYKEFDGKEDCFVQVYERAVTGARSHLAAAVSPSADWATQAALGLRALVEYAAEQPMAARVVLLEAQTGGEQTLRRHGQTLREAADFLRRGRDARPAQRVLPESFEEATLSGLVWLLQARLAKGKIEDAPELWTHMAKIVLEAYRGKVQADRVLRTID